MECRDVCVLWFEEDGRFLDWGSWCTVSLVQFLLGRGPYGSMTDVHTGEAWLCTQVAM